MNIDILFFAALFLIEATLCARAALRGYSTAVAGYRD